MRERERADIDPVVGALEKGSRLGHVMVGDECWMNIRLPQQEVSVGPTFIFYTSPSHSSTCMCLCGLVFLCVRVYVCTCVW